MNAPNMYKEGCEDKKNLLIQAWKNKLFISTKSLHVVKYMYLYLYHGATKTTHVHIQSLTYTTCLHVTDCNDCKPNDNWVLDNIICFLVLRHNVCLCVYSRYSRYSLAPSKHALECYVTPAILVYQFKHTPHIKDLLSHFNIMMITANCQIYTLHVIITWRPFTQCNNG